VFLWAQWAETAGGSAPGCRWLSSADGGEESSTIRCQLRTLQSAEWRKQIESVKGVDGAQSLQIECSDVLFFESALERQLLAQMPQLRSLSIADCKVREMQSASLASLTQLRTLSIRTHNTDWPAMALTLTHDSLAGLRQLRSLDLSDNSLISTPENLFCALTTLTALNLSKNRLQDVTSLGLGGTQEWPCLQQLERLDLAQNSLTEVPPLAFQALRRLETLNLQQNALRLMGDGSLAQLGSLRTLNLSSNELSVLAPELFSDCHDLRELDLHANRLSIVAHGALSGLVQLQVLDLSANALGADAVHRDTFAGLVRLVVLNLGSNWLDRIDAALFGDLASLQVLRLDANVIATVDADAFLPLLNLHTLDLSGNRIQVVGDGLLAGLYVLSSLSLASNEIDAVSGDALRNVSGLRDLDLSGNRLLHVPAGLTHLTLLKSLDLSKNRIARIESNLSVGSSGAFSQLYSLNLAENDIRFVAKEALSGLVNLVALNLAANGIETLEGGCFDRASALQVLRLDANRLRDVNNLFHALHNLRWLNVSGNEVSTLDYSFLPAAIEWLDVHENKLTHLGNYFQIQLAHLQVLDASFNEIQELTQDSIPDAVVQLFVNNNRIRSIAANAFLKKSNLSRVDLNWNALATLDAAALWLSPVAPHRDLPEFSLGDNPWQCDCNLEWLPQLVQPSSSARQQPRLIDAADMSCTLSFQRTLGAQRQRQPVPIVDVRPEEFLCPYRTHCFALCHCCDFDACDCEMTCPSGCSCYHDPTWTANIVDCSASASALNLTHTQLPQGIPMDVTQLHLDGNNLTQLSSHAFIGRKMMHTLYLNASGVEMVRNRTFHGLGGSLRVLHLEDNLLREIAGSEFEALDHLRELYLQRNRIRWMADTALVHLRALSVLRIDGNALVTFPMWRLGVNAHLTQLSLAANPWSCDCRFLDELQQWMRLHRQRVVDATLVQCLIDAEHAPLDMGHFNATCSDSGTAGTLVVRRMASVMDFLPLLIAGVVLTLLVALLLVLALTYRETVRIWIFSRYKIRLCRSRKDCATEGQRKQFFDAFVSYSRKDEQFVSQTLAAQLEHGAESFRLCLQHRDFPNSSATDATHSTAVGDPLTLGLSASRRIVLVISQSFVESEWTRPELRAALTGFLRNRMQIISVLTSDWTHDADAQLNVLLASSIRIRCGDANFWPKIRYFLPDPAPRHYIRNLRNSATQLWYHTQPNATKRSSPHPLPSPLPLTSAPGGQKNPHYWDIHAMNPRRYTATPQHNHATDVDPSVYSQSQYSRLEHSYVSIDHGHEHIYSSVQQHHPDCCSYPSCCPNNPQCSAYLQHPHQYPPTPGTPMPRPPVHQPEFRNNFNNQQHSTFLV